MVARKLFSVAAFVRMDRFGVAGKHLRGKMGFWSTITRLSRVGNALRGGTKSWSRAMMDELDTMMLSLCTQCRHVRRESRFFFNYSNPPYCSCHAVSMLAEVLEPPQTTITTLSSARTGLPRALSSLPP